MLSKKREEKNAAIFVQQTLENLILHKPVTLENISLEKYGRLLADVIFYDEEGALRQGQEKRINLSTWLLENNYAVEYDGGKKQVPKHWKQYMRTGKLK